MLNVSDIEPRDHRGHRPTHARTDERTVHDTVLLAASSVRVGCSGLGDVIRGGLAADLELQYTVHRPRDQADVRRVDPPVPVDGWRRIGELDAWINEGGRWLGRVRHADGRVSFIDQSEIRPAPEQGAS